MTPLWTMQQDGSFLGVPTSKATKWAGGDRHKLAAICFAAWCRDHDLLHEWYLDTWQTVSVQGAFDKPRPVLVLLDQSNTPDYFFVTEEGQSGQRYAIVRIFGSNEPIAHILGITGILDQTQTRFDGKPIPRHQLLRCRDILHPDQRAAYERLVTTQTTTRQPTHP